MSKKETTDTNENTQSQETDLTNKNEEKESDDLEEALKESNFNVKNLEDLYKQNLLLKQQIVNQH